MFQLKPYLSLNDQRLIAPRESLKRGYGILKIKKPGMGTKAYYQQSFFVDLRGRNLFIENYKTYIKKM